MISANQRRSLLQNADDLPLFEEQMVRELGRTMVIAPQPDAESLGCGGLLALLRKHHQHCSVVFLGDGSASHPNSASFPPPALVKLRKYEALMALTALGVDKNLAKFMGLIDGQLPGSGDAEFIETAYLLAEYLKQFYPDTLIVPWRRDPNGDCRAAYELAGEALTHLDYHPRLLEYPVWSRIQTSHHNAPHPGEMIGWRVDTSSVQNIKLRAIGAHLSQLGQIVDDDPEGFHLHPHMLKPFLLPYDVFLEPSYHDKPLSAR